MTGRKLDFDSHIVLVDESKDMPEALVPGKAKVAGGTAWAWGPRERS